MNRLDQHLSNPAARLVWPAVRSGLRHPCGPAALLIGLGVSLLLTDLVARFEMLFGWTQSGRQVVAGGLICLAVGPLIPLRVAALVGWRRPLLRGMARGDVPLLWTMLAVFALLAGLVTALTPTWLPVLRGGCEWLDRDFLWTPRVLVFVRLSIVMACLLPVLTLLGLALSCLHRLAARDLGWNIAPLGWALIGAGLGRAASRALLDVGLTTDRLFLVAAVPFLLVAALSAQPAGGFQARSVPAGVRRDLPCLGDRSPVLLRLTAVWLLLAAGAVIVVWPQVWAQRPGSVAAAGPITPTFLAAMAGVGLVICARSQWSGSPSMGGLGLACAICGLGVAAAAGLPAICSVAWPSERISGFVLTVVGGAAALLVGGVSGLGQLAILCRVGSRAASGAALLCLSLLGVAALLLAVPEPTVDPRGSFVQLAAVALSLAAVGGAAIIHEPTCSTRARRWRLAAVAASVGLMIYGLPIAGRCWKRQSNQRPFNVQQLDPPAQASASDALAHK